MRRIFLLKSRSFMFFGSLIITGTLLLSGCAVIGALAIAKNATCSVKVDDKSIRGSCDLTNGVFFERLTVLSKDSIGMPAEYIVTERFQCYNPGMDGLQKYWPDKICFKKANGHYKWKCDTVSVQYRTTPYHRTLVSIIKKPVNFYDNIILDSKVYDTCPSKFSKDSWYHVKIADRRLRSVFIYIDTRGKFNVYKFDSGVCPI